MDSLSKKAQREYWDWILEQDCSWAICTFRVDGQWQARSEKAFKGLRWTVEDVQRRLNKKKKLCFVPYVGGEPESGIAAHVHALVEIPRGATLEALAQRLEAIWPSYLRKACGNDASAAKVWIDAFQPYNGEELLRYFARYEGKTFSSGLDKALLGLTYLNPYRNRLEDRPLQHKG